MNTRIGIGGAMTLLALLWSQAGLAQGGCGDIEFSDEINQRFPGAKEACIEIVERDGRQYAHFEAEIVRVRGNTVEAQFKAPDGTVSNPIAFTPPSGARVSIAGRSYRYSELDRGQELDVWLPPDRWEIAVPRDTSADFATAQVVTPVPLEEPSTELAALPATASRLPWLAVLGLVFLGFGGVLARVARPH